MATYDNDLRLKEITPGDEDGIWGESNNDNLSMVAEAFGFGNFEIPSDGNATATIDDGTSSQARRLFLQVTSAVDLTDTRTLTLAPNTVSKVWIVENATSGEQDIDVSQGSGDSVTIPSGEKVLLVSDGGGSSASVTGITLGEPAEDLEYIGGQVLCQHRGLSIRRLNSSDVRIQATALGLEGPTNFRASSVDVTITMGSVGVNAQDNTGSDGWWYAWVIYNPTSETVAGLASKSSTSPAMPSGYVSRGLVGAFYTEGGGSVREFRQVGNRTHIPRVEVYKQSQITPNSYVPVDLSSYIPPIATGISGSVGVTDPSEEDTSIYAAFYGTSDGDYILVEIEEGGSFLGDSRLHPYDAGLITASSMYARVEDSGHLLDLTVTSYSLGGP